MEHMSYYDSDKAYLNDPHFHVLVDVLINQIMTLSLTPSELRAAANYASIKVEQQRDYIHFVNGSNKEVK